jgi:hypothetical protein
VAHIVQKITEDYDDIEEIRDRTDVEIVETDKEILVIRTTAVQEQSTACQLIILLVERLQQHFYPYIEQTVRALVPLMTSPHDDIRGYSLALMPELIRATARAVFPDRAPVVMLSEYIIGQMIACIESDSNLDIIMTGLQALQSSINYACFNWDGDAQNSPESAKRKSEGGFKFLTPPQLLAITQCAKIVLRDSLQRRAVLRAEAQVILLTINCPFLEQRYICIASSHI